MTRLSFVLIAKSLLENKSRTTSGCRWALESPPRAMCLVVAVTGHVCSSHCNTRPGVSCRLNCTFIDAWIRVRLFCISEGLGLVLRIAARMVLRCSMTGRLLGALRLRKGDDRLAGDALSWLRLPPEFDGVMRPPSKRRRVTVFARATAALVCTSCLILARSCAIARGLVSRFEVDRKSAPFTGLTSATFAHRNPHFVADSKLPRPVGSPPLSSLPLSSFSLLARLHTTLLRTRPLRIVPASGFVCSHTISPPP